MGSFAVAGVVVVVVRVGTAMKAFWSRKTWVLESGGVEREFLFRSSPMGP